MNKGRVKNPTPRQKKLAEALVLNELDNNPKHYRELLKNADFGKSVQNNPHKVLNSEGLQVALRSESLREALEKAGVTREKIAEKIGVLLEAKTEKETDDYGAIDRGLTHATKIYGVADEPEKPQTGNTYNFIFSDSVQEKVKVIDAEIKDMLTKGHENSEEDKKNN